MGTITSAPKAITAFTGRWDFLSNFHPSPLAMSDRIIYPTGEHAFQAQKTWDLEVRRAIASYELPGAAKQAGRRIDLRGDWEAAKKQVMLRVVLNKFTQSLDLAAKLLATGNAVLVEGNTWHDNYWGDCHCGRTACDTPGLNYLGQILMAVRLVLRDDQRTDHP